VGVVRIHDYLADAKVTCSWTCHIQKHISDLGVDTVSPNGTPILASFDGVLRNRIRPEPKGFPSLYIAYLDSDEAVGMSFEHMHLSKFATEGHYTMGQVIGWSGGARGEAGAGQAQGAHLHRNAVVAGKLVPVSQIFSQFASVGPVTPVTDPSTEEEDMRYYEDGGTTLINSGQFYQGSPGKFVKVNNADWGGDNFVRASITAYAGPIALAPSADLPRIQKMWLDLAYPAGGSTTDIGPVLAAIEALDTQDDNYHAQVTAALAAVPANVVKAEGAALANG
jgi:hypothetical protein